MKIIDIPSGYLYGFPRVYDKPEELSLEEWLISLGVPKSHAEKCIYIRMWGDENEQ